MNLEITLQYSKKKQKSKSDGVTLIELIVVLVLIGIIAAFAIPNYYKSMERGKADEALANLKAIRSAQRIYRVDTLSWADDVNSLNSANLIDVSLRGTEANDDGTVTGNTCKTAGSDTPVQCTSEYDGYCYRVFCPNAANCAAAGTADNALARAYRCRKGTYANCTYKIKVGGTIIPEVPGSPCPKVPANL